MESTQVFITTKVVKAEPMTYGHFTDCKERKMDKSISRYQEGFHVIYPDGYSSWCPKEEFERTSRQISAEEKQMIGTSQHS